MLHIRILVICICCLALLLGMFSSTIYAYDDEPNHDSSNSQTSTTDPNLIDWGLNFETVHRPGLSADGNSFQYGKSRLIDTNTYRGWQVQIGNGGPAIDSIVETYEMHFTYAAYYLTQTVGNEKTRLQFKAGLIASEYGWLGSGPYYGVGGSLGVAFLLPLGGSWHHVLEFQRYMINGQNYQSFNISILFMFGVGFVGMGTY